MPELDKTKRTDLAGTQALVQDVMRRYKLQVSDLKADKPLNITYTELKALRDSGELEAGRLYRITDYVTTVGSQITNARSVGHRFDLVVLATSSNTIAGEAQAVKHEYPSNYIPADTSAPDYQEKYDEVHYFDNVPMDRWKIDYCLDNDTSKFQWACNADYTFINITSDPAPYNEHLLRYAAGDAEGADYPYCWGDSYFHVYTASDTPAVGDTAYGASDGTGKSYTLSVVREVAGKGVIYHMVDDLLNDLLFDFKNIQFKRYETGDKSELVVDSAFLTDDFDGAATKMAMAVNADMLGDGMNNNNYACYYGYYRNEFVYGSALSGNFVGYDLVTPKAIDTTAMYKCMAGRSNSKRIFCKVTAIKWFYPFHIKGDTENGRDVSIIPYVYGTAMASGNKIRSCLRNAGVPVLQDCVFLLYNNNQTVGTEIITADRATFGTSSSSNIGRIVDCTFGYISDSDIDLAYNSGIKNIQLCKIKTCNNTFGGTWNNNHIEALGNCILKTITYSTILGNCPRLAIDNCSGMVIDNCMYITLGNSVNNSQFINTTEFLLGSSFLSPDGYVKGLKVDNADYVKLLCAETTSAAVPLQNVKIGAGVSGTSADWKTITVPVAGQEYEIEYKTTDSQTIFV